MVYNVYPKFDKKDPKSYMVLYRNRATDVSVGLDVTLGNVSSSIQATAKSGGIFEGNRLKVRI